MSAYDDDYQPRPRRHKEAGGYPPVPPVPPYPPQSDIDDNAPMPNERRPRQARFDGNNGARPPPPPDGAIPPPPMGATMDGGPGGPPPSAMKRDGSRSRVPSGLKPDFPDEASYLASQAPDVERKKGRAYRDWKERRDGYESEEGEQLRRAKPRRHDDRDLDEGDSRRRPAAHDRDRPPPYDDERQPSRRHRDQQDERDPPSRRRRDEYGDDDRAPARRRGGGQSDVEYGSEPVPIRRRNTERARPSRRRGDYEEEEDDGFDDRQRRHRSVEDRSHRREGAGDQGRDQYRDPDSREARRRRQDMYDRDRDDRRPRRRYDDDEDDYDRSDRRDRDRDRDRRRRPTELKIGKYDIGPLVDQGRKHYSTVAPILTPIVMQMAQKYMKGAR